MPISMSEDGEIIWVNEAPVLDVQKALRTLMDRVAILEAESKARKVAETPLLSKRNLRPPMLNKKNM